MSDALIQAVQQSQLKTDLPVISVGDTIDVHVRIVERSKEGVKETSKERIQVFTGVVIKKQGGGLDQTITVRRIVANEGVERIFPVNSPNIARIEIKRHGHARRAKLYYLRDRVGKKRRLKDRRRGMGWLVQQQEKQAAEAAEARQAEQTADDEAAPTK